MVVYVRTREQRRSPLRTLIRLLVVMTGLGLVLGLLAIVLLTLAIYAQARRDETAPADAIVVLGAAQWDGRPSPTLAARLDHAYDLYQQHDAPLIVLTGGAGQGDRYSEAGVGRSYLIERGVPANAVVAVGSGRSSWQSLQAAQDALLARGVRSVLLVSDPFHMYRVKRMTEDLGLDALASPTRSSPIRPGSPLEYRYIAREVAAYLAYTFLKQ